MNRKENALSQMLTNMADFAAQHVSWFPKTSAVLEILKALESGVKTLSEEARTIVSADTAIRIGSSQRKASRGNLRSVLTLAGQIAEALNTGKFQMPATRSDSVLINSAKALLVDAESMRKDFAKHGLAFETVTAAVESFEQAIVACSNARAMRSGAVQRWNVALDESLGALKRYDALVAATLGDDPAAMAEYAVARAIPRTGSRKAAAAETPPETVTPPTPAPAPAPVPVTPPAVVPAA